MKPLVSIIIPVYNGEKYIGKCLDSILKQTLIEWECIIVNDGSKDNTASIIDDYATHDNRFLVIHKQNEGVSIARNIALAMAHGEWIAFSDADDYYYPEGIQTLYNTAKETGVKIVLGNAACIQMNGKIFNRYLYFKQREIQNCFPKGSLEMWGDLFHYSLFTHSELTFTPKLAYLEDRFLMLKLLSTIGQYATCPMVVYGHYKNPDSVVESKDGLRMARHCFWAARLIKDYAAEAKAFRNDILIDSHKAIIRACTYFLKSKNASLDEFNKVYHEYFSDSKLWKYLLYSYCQKIMKKMRKNIKQILKKS